MYAPRATIDSMRKINQLGQSRMVRKSRRAQAEQDAPA